MLVPRGADSTIGADLIGVLEDQEVKTDIHQHPSERRNRFDNKVGREHHVPHQAVAGEGEKDTEVRWVLRHRLAYGNVAGCWMLEAGCSMADGSQGVPGTRYVVLS